MKKCSKCKEVKPIEAFGRDKRHPTRLQARCKQCDAEYVRKWRAENREEYLSKRRAYGKAFRRKYPEKVRAEDKKRSLKKTYGLTAKDVLTMTDSQDHKCLLCGTELKPRSTDIDHDHESGRVRGILCRKCNLGLGFFNDDPAMFEKAIEYVSTYAIDAEYF